MGGTREREGGRGRRKRGREGEGGRGEREEGRTRERGERRVGERKERCGSLNKKVYCTEVCRHGGRSVEGCRWRSVEGCRWEGCGRVQVWKWESGGM